MRLRHGILSFRQRGCRSSRGTARQLRGAPLARVLHRGGALFRWDRGTVSVWDLGAIEDEAHQDGNFAVWEEEAQQQMARQDAAMRKQAIDSDWQNGP